MKKEFRFYIYIVSNFERSTLYVGLTNDMVRRLLEHKYGFGSIFTRKYKLQFLVYYEYYQYIHDAINREKEIKNWRREKKMALIKSINPELNDLSSEFLGEHSAEEIIQIVSELKEKYAEGKKSLGNNLLKISRPAASR